jgi:hypothetical protein
MKGDKEEIPFYYSHSRSESTCFDPSGPQLPLKECDPVRLLPGPGLALREVNEDRASIILSFEFGSQILAFLSIYILLEL